LPEGFIPFGYGVIIGFACCGKFGHDGFRFRDPGGGVGFSRFDPQGVSVAGDGLGVFLPCEGLVSQREGLPVLFFQVGQHLSLSFCFPPGVFFVLEGFLFERNRLFYFCKATCGIAVTGLYKERLEVVFPGPGPALQTKLAVCFPDISVVFFCILFIQFSLQTQNGNEVVDFCDPVLRILFRRENSAGRLVVAQGGNIFPAVEFGARLLEQFVVLLFKFGQFGRRQFFEQVGFPPHILALPDGLVNQPFYLGIVVIEFRYEIVDRWGVIDFHDGVVGERPVNSFYFRKEVDVNGKGGEFPVAA
jgi:hypothetical protein